MLTTVRIDLSSGAWISIYLHVIATPTEGDELSGANKAELCLTIELDGGQIANLCVKLANTWVGSESRVMPLPRLHVPSSSSSSALSGRHHLRQATDKWENPWLGECACVLLVLGFLFRKFSGADGEMGIRIWAWCWMLDAWCQWQATTRAIYKHYGTNELSYNLSTASDRVAALLLPPFFLFAFPLAFFLYIP